MQFKNLPFPAIAATGYVIGNGTLTLKGYLFEGKTLIPQLSDLQNLEPSSWQALAGFCWLTISFLTYAIAKYPDKITKIIASINYVAYFCMLTSAYTQEGFWAQAIGITPWFFAASLLFQGNKVKEKGSILRKYPVACAGFIFAAGNIGIAYNGFVSGDYVLFLLGILFIFANLTFSLTDKTFQKRIFN